MYISVTSSVTLLLHMIALLECLIVILGNINLISSRHKAILSPTFKTPLNIMFITNMACGIPCGDFCSSAYPQLLAIVMHPKI